MASCFRTNVPHYAYLPAWRPQRALWLRWEASDRLPLRRSAYSFIIRTHTLGPSFRPGSQCLAYLAQGSVHVEVPREGFLGPGIEHPHYIIGVARL